ncbi:MAG: hypothetical protein RLZZ511_4229 [Cyanobacteriota bacterium]
MSNLLMPLLAHAEGNFADQVGHALEPAAALFRGMNLPEPLTHWGHPFFMSIVIFLMGGFVAMTGWKSRLSQESEVVDKSRADHRKVAPLMTVFLTTGYSGGLLSLVMQNKPVLESPHFWTGTIVLSLLWFNGSLAFLGIKGPATLTRSIHAYVGSAIVALLLVHVALGLNLGISI